jgi:hypothetical protein
MAVSIDKNLPGTARPVRGGLVTVKMLGTQNFSAFLPSVQLSFVSNLY